MWVQQTILELMQVIFLVLIREPMQVLLRIPEHTRKDSVVTMLAVLSDLRRILVHTREDLAATMQVDM